MRWTRWASPLRVFYVLGGLPTRAPKVALIQRGQEKLFLEMVAEAGFWGANPAFLTRFRGGVRLCSPPEAIAAQ
eukprot:2360157-Lingulodinium_polyedra.AAC.1